jgi:uncharacterized protein (TIGR00369 family)
MNYTLLDLNTPVELINEAMQNGIVSSLGIKITGVEYGLVEGFFILSDKNCRPDGFLHGGTNLAFAETLAGLGSMLITDLKEYDVLGTHVSGSHTGMLKTGRAKGEARILHRGNKTHVWNVDVRNEEGRLISTIHVTNMIVKRNGRTG